MRTTNKLLDSNITGRTLLIFGLFLIAAFVLAEDGIIWEESPLDVVPYEPEQWVEYEDSYPACDVDIFEHNAEAIVISSVYINGDLPNFGYPYHKALVAGVNDTLQARITLFNRTAKPFSFKGSGYEEWFAPQVYQLWVTDSEGPAFRDSTQLGYRIRGWYYRNTKIPPLDTLTAAMSSDYALVMDIYNLPQEGRFQICLLPTDKVPKEFSAVPGGLVFEYYPAESVCDSVNGYEACFWRAISNGDRESAKKWLKSILSINPYSVPGWWLSAIAEMRYWEKPDTTAAKLAYDNAIKYMDSNQDSCMPDSTMRALRQAEINYLEWMRPQLEYGRQQLGE